MNCLLCHKKVASLRGLSHHIKAHDITPEQYTLTYLCNGERPLCKCGCGNVTNYMKKNYKFNDFIHNHHRPQAQTKTNNYIPRTNKMTEVTQEMIDTLNEQMKQPKLKGRTAPDLSKLNMLGADYRSELRDFLIDTYKTGQIVENVDGADFLLPQENLAISLNGLYAHSEIFVDKKYHYNLFLSFREKGIKLLQIHEDEWGNKKDVWKSIIKTNLGLSERKLDARKLTLDENPVVSSVIEFVNENHLQGYCRAKKKFVLKESDGSIVFCVTFRIPFTKNKAGAVEIARICSAKDTVVRGGFTRVMKHALDWAKREGYTRVLTYSDCRYSYGAAYKNNEFAFVGHTGVGYDYTDFTKRENRFTYRAQENKPEVVVAEESHVYKLYNTGNFRWERRLTE